MEKLTVAQQKLVKKLQRGDRLNISKKLGFTQNYVYMVLRGEAYNEDIWGEAAKIALERDQKEQQIIKVAESLH